MRKTGRNLPLKTCNCDYRKGGFYKGWIFVGQMLKDHLTQFEFHLATINSVLILSRDKFIT